MAIYYVDVSKLSSLSIDVYDRLLRDCMDDSSKLYVSNICLAIFYVSSCRVLLVRYAVLYVLASLTLRSIS